MSPVNLTTSYQLIAELLLHPLERDAARVANLRSGMGDGPADVSRPIAAFLDSSLAGCPDEYVQTVELSPPCPLYLGAYLFEEPASCRGAGMSDRNAYMLELAALYRHFGFELSGQELPDYVPALAEFLALSLERPERDATGLRRWLIERYVAPALDAMRSRFAEYQSPYEALIEALSAVVREDLRRMDDRPAWKPPDAAPTWKVQKDVPGKRLPVLTDESGAAAPVAARFGARGRFAPTEYAQ